MPIPNKKTLKKEILSSIEKNPPQNTAEMCTAISALAYQYYLESGGEHGHDLEDWLRAEQEIKLQLKKSET